MKTLTRKLYLYKGGAMFIHAFGAYFGLAVSLMHRNRNVGSSEALEGSRYTSDIFALVHQLEIINQNKIDLH